MRSQPAHTFAKLLAPLLKFFIAEPMADTETLPRKFFDPDITERGERRASVHWRGLKTLWLNMGTLCNIECVNCYIESSPKNDRLVYLTLEDVLPYLDEIDALDKGGVEIGVTGGEPFLAPEIISVLEACLSRGHSVLVLTNAMRPMMRPHLQSALLDLNQRFGARLTLRVSLDHYSEPLHDAERGKGSFKLALEGVRWLAQNAFNLALAGRTILTEDVREARLAYVALARSIGIEIDPDDEKTLVLFPEMIPGDNPPEITTQCWDILKKDPAQIMCANQRMVVKRKGEAHPVVTACTLLPYDKRFELGQSLKDATAKPVKLNHPWCASFCVLGGGSCSA